MCESRFFDAWVKNHFFTFRESTISMHRHGISTLYLSKHHAMIHMNEIGLLSVTTRSVTCLPGC